MIESTYLPNLTNSKSFALIVALFLMVTISRAQNIHFTYTDGTDASYSLEDVRKITFDLDVMYLHLWDSSIYAWNVSTIGDYQYSESLLNVQDLLTNANAWDVSVFPNPTSSSLNVRFNLLKAEEVFIGLYDISGKLILENNLGNIESGEYHEVFNLNSIPQGTYVCRISGQHNTIIKQVIKQ